MCIKILGEEKPNSARSKSYGGAEKQIGPLHWAVSDLDANQIKSPPARTNYECGIEWLMDFRFQF